MSKEIVWSLDTIRSKIRRILEDARGYNLSYLRIEKLRVEGDNLIVEGRGREFFRPEFKFKVVLKNTNLNLVEYEGG